MTTKEIQSGLFQICAKEPGLRVFREISFTDRGLCYSVYMMDAGDCMILLGSLPARYCPALLDTIQRLAEEKPVRYGIFFGTKEDALFVQALTAQLPELCIIGGKSLLFRLESLDCLSNRTIEIRTKRTLRIGNRTLEFHVLEDRMETPALYVIEQDRHTLFTADAFGSLGTEYTNWRQGAKQYFKDISGPNRTKVMGEAARLVRSKEIRTICPAIGQAVNANLDALLGIYEAKYNSATEAPVVAILHSGGSALSTMTAKITEGICSVDNYLVPEVWNLDLSRMSRDEVLELVPQADAFLFGTEDCDGNAAKCVWDIATSLRRSDVKGKRAAVFYMKNTGEHIPDGLRAYLGTLGMNLDLPDWFVQGTLHKNDLKNAVDYGYGIGCYVLGIPNPSQPKLVKCLVCGEIFDASLGTCPVCGVGLDQCVPVDEAEIGYKKDTDQYYLIVGGCAAAIAAAEAIRQRDTTGTITLLSAEDHLPINRPMLTKGMDIAVNETETILAHPASWYEEREIRLHLGAAATAIHPESRTVETEDGTAYPYDKLILATGAECFVPPIPGHDKSGVITVRHLSDAQDMWQRMKTARNAVVIGGGVLGLEAAAEFMRSAIPVTVLEATPQIMGRQIDGTSAEILMDIMRKSHIECYQGISVAAIEGGEHVTGVRLGDGRVFPADVVVMSCGARANIQLAADAGIQTDRAITVNMFMETSLPDIYACGDCCALGGVNYQLVQEAMEQGRVAGANAAGERAAYRSHLFGTHIEGVGAAMFAMGDPGKNPDLKYKTVTTTDEVEGRHERYWFSGGALQGAVVINADEKIPEITDWVETRARHEDIC